MADAINAASTATLLVLRDNLLKGLDEVARHIDAGTFETIRKASPPSQSGQMTLSLLLKVDHELRERGELSA